MVYDPLDRVILKLDTIDEKLTKIREEAAADRQKLNSHLLECSDRNGVVHRRIDDIKRTQRWWAGKLLGAAAAGGGLSEIIRQMFGGKPH